jgi:hypothetical protein
MRLRGAGEVRQTALAVAAVNVAIYQISKLLSKLRPASFGGDILTSVFRRAGSGGRLPGWPGGRLARASPLSPTAHCCPLPKTAVLPRTELPFCTTLY